MPLYPPPPTPFPLQVGIERAAACVDALGDEQDIFAAWLRGTPCTPDASHTLAPDAWQTQTTAIIRRTLDPDDPATRCQTALILGTTKGDIHRVVDWIRTAPPHAPDPPTLSSMAARIAADCGIADPDTGVPPPWAVSAACASGLVALIEAAITVLDGLAPRALAVASDIAGDFVHDGFTALKALSPSGACRPFDRQRDGLVLGSGAAACLLAPAGPHSLAILRGWGLSNDACHMTAPDRDANGLIRAMNAALLMANLKPRDIDVVVAHGTGTRYNDAMEAVALEKVFLRHGARPAVTAAKGLIGHTLGASGLLEAVLALDMLQTGLAPGVVGLQTPERDDLGLVIGRRAHADDIRHIMKLASGFGGFNAAVILSDRPAPQPSPQKTGARP